jgi:hypothetical protein
MKKYHRYVIELGRRYVAPFDGTVEITKNRTHPHLIVTIGGRSKSLPFAGSPRQIDQGLKHCEHQLRKMVQEMVHAR